MRTRKSRKGRHHKGTKRASRTSMALAPATAPEAEPQEQRSVASTPARKREGTTTQKGIAPPDALEEAFFKQGDELEGMFEGGADASIPPTTDDLPKGPVSPAPEVLRRRSRFRAVVATVVGLGALVVLVGFVKTIAGGRHAVAAVNPPSATVASGGSTSYPSLIQSAPKPPVAPPAESSVVEAASSLAAVDDPRKEAFALLNRGQLADAIPMARMAIQRDPGHAFGYLYLGAALQEQGKRNDAMNAYDACLRNAKSGPIWECRALGGRVATKPHR